jgi:hypothetical protein
MRAGGPGRPAEADDARPQAARDGHHRGIVAVEHGPVLARLRREEARLRVAIVGEARMAVEMVVGHVQEAADVRAEALDPLELEARHLGDADVPLGLEGRDERRAEVPARERAPAGRREREADERRRRALAVRSGDPDDRTREPSRCDLDLARDRDPAPPRLDEDGRRARHAGARHDQRDVGEQLRAVVAEAELDARHVARLGADRRRRPRIADPHALAARRQHARHRLPRAPEADDEHAPRHRRHRSFRVERASSAQTIETIQKRTMICGSGQPRSSK